MTNGVFLVRLQSQDVNKPLTELNTNLDHHEKPHNHAPSREPHYDLNDPALANPDDFFKLQLLKEYKRKFSSHTEIPSELRDALHVTTG